MGVVSEVVSIHNQPISLAEHRIKCAYRLVIDNLMDLTHETYVHARSIGQPELMETPIETRAEGDKVFVTRRMAGVDAPPFWSVALKQTGKVDRWQTCEFIAPSAVIIDVGVARFGAGATLANHDGGCAASKPCWRALRSNACCRP